MLLQGSSARSSMAYAANVTNPTNNHQLSRRTNSGTVGRTPDLPNREITYGFGIPSYNDYRCCYWAAVVRISAVVSLLPNYNLKPAKALPNSRVQNVLFASILGLL